jgi:hypothetical protein
MRVVRDGTGGESQVSSHSGPRGSRGSRIGATCYQTGESSGGTAPAVVMHHSRFATRCVVSANNAPPSAPKQFAIRSVTEGYRLVE